MKRFFSRAAVAGLSAALVAGVALVAAPAANAAQIGTLTFNGLTGKGVTFTALTSGACAAPATNFQIGVTGGNLPAAPTNITGNTSGGLVSGFNTGPFTAPFSFTLDGYATNNGLTTLGDGTYTVTLRCRDSIVSTSLGDYVGTFTVAGAVVTPAVPAAPVTTTTTVVSASPAAGSTTLPATFTASVSPAAAVGTVQFSVDGALLGSPVVLTAGSATSPATGLLTAGNHNVVATYSGAFVAPGTTYSGSTSATFVYAVTQPTGTSTTNLTLASATVAYPASNLATATVSSASGTINAGTVQFKVDGVNYGAPVTVSATGVATSAISQNVQAAAYSVTAVYSGATIAGIAVSGSTSPAATFTVTAPTYTPDVQYIRTSVPAGTLVISTPYTGSNPLDLGPMVLNATATEYKSTGAFTGIQVTDTRAGNLPYTLSALASDLAKGGVVTPGVNERISGQNVGLTGLTLTSTNATPGTFLGGVAAGGSTTGQNLTGFDNPAASHVLAGSAGSLGLGTTSKTVLHANSGLGTTVTAGTLTITAPTNTVDGTYTGTVTFTIIGS